MKAFDVGDWLRRWRANGNAAELAEDGRIWLIYGPSGDWRERDALEAELRRDAGAGTAAVKAYLSGRSP
jgi:hypothetical protein